MTYRQALHDTLRAEMLRDDSVFLMGEEIGVFEGSYKITAGLLKEFGEKRVRDTPIAEEGFAGAAIGAAMLGLRPVVEMMTINFSMLALDQIINHAAKIYGMFGGQASVPLVIRTPGGGGQQLGATHSQNIELFYAFVPGMKVVAPSNPADAKALLLAAIRDNDPVLFLENLALYNTKGEVPDDDTPAEIGRAAVTRPGRDLTLIGYSRMAHVAAEVAASLAESDGLDIEVVDLRSLRPLDRETIIESVKKTHAAVVLEDDWLTYGIGAEVAASISDGAFDYLDAPVRRVAMAEVPMPYSKPLETAALPSRDDVITAIRQTLAAVGHRDRAARARSAAAVIEIKMPRLSDTMEEGAISTWRKQPGDAVAVGDVLVEIETDKAVMEYEAYQAGTLAEILVPEGQNADIGAPIALLDDGTGGPARVRRRRPRAKPIRPNGIAALPSGATATRRPGTAPAAASPASDRNARNGSAQRQRPPGRLTPGAEAGQGEPPGPVARHGQRTRRPHHPRRHQRPAGQRRPAPAAPAPPRCAGRRRPCPRHPPPRLPCRAAPAPAPAGAPARGRADALGDRRRSARHPRRADQPGPPGDRPPPVRQRPRDPALLRDRGRGRAGADGPAGDAERAAHRGGPAPRSASMTC